MESIVLKVSFCEEDIVEDIEVLINIKLLYRPHYVYTFRHFALCSLPCM